MEVFIYKLQKKLMQKIFSCQTVSLCSGYEKIVELLIRNGAEINLEGQYGSTALSLAAARGKERIF